MSEVAVRATEAAEAVRRMCQEQAAQRSLTMVREEALNVLAAWCNEKGIGYEAFRNRSAVYAAWSRVNVALKSCENSFSGAVGGFIEDVCYEYDNDKAKDS